MKVSLGEFALRNKLATIQTIRTHILMQMAECSQSRRGQNSYHFMEYIKNYYKSSAKIY